VSSIFGIHDANEGVWCMIYEFIEPDWIVENLIEGCFCYGYIWEHLSEARCSFTGRIVRPTLRYVLLNI